MNKRELSYNQVMNITHFTILMVNSDDSIIDKDPSYIKEKWDDYIKVPISTLRTNDILPNYSKKIISLIEKYKLRWRISDEEMSEIYPIILYLYSIHSHNLCDIVKVYNTYINNPNVNEKPFDGGIHPLLKEIIRENINNEYNKTYLDYLKRNTEIDKILSN